MVAKQKSALSGVIKDLESQITILTKERDSLKKSLGKANSNISETRQKELALQKLLANIEEKEAKLQEHKKNLQTRSDKVSDKLSKMSKVRSEMKDI